MDSTGQFEPRLRIARWLFCGLAVLAAGLSVEAQRPDERVATTFSDQDRTALGYVILTDRASVAVLKQLQQRISEGNLTSAAELLHQWSAPRGGGRTSDDGLFWDAQVRLKSLRREARQAFDELGEAAVDVTEELYGAEAKRNLDAALRANSQDRLIEIAQQYYFTIAGFRALDQVATLALDAGRPNDAAAIWLDLIDSKAHARRVTPRLIAKMVAALAVTGRQQDIDALLTTAQERFALTADQINHLRANATRQTPLTRHNQEWSTAFGDVTQNTVAAGSAPYLRPLWSGSLEPDSTSVSSAMRAFLQTLEEVEQWNAAQEAAPVGTAVFPLVIRDQVVVRDLAGLSGRALRTGQPLWRYRSPVTIADVWASVRELVRTDRVAVEISYFGNAATGMPCTSGGRIFAVEWLGIDKPEGNDAANPPAQRGVNLRRRTRLGVRCLNRLICLEPPTAAQATTDREVRLEPVWAVGGRSDDDGDPLAGHTFVGPPLPLGDSLFVMTEANQELNLIRLDMTTGRLQWLQRLCMVELPLLEPSEHFRLPTASILAEDHSTIICPTDVGVLVAVDAVRGELKWVYLYEPPQNLRRQQSHRGFIGWPDPPHLHAGSVVYLPRNSGELHCVDLQSGKFEWTVSRGDARYVAAVTDEVIVVVGNETVRGLARHNGQTLWMAKPGGTAGRGVWLNDVYVVPLRSGAVAAVEIATGRIRGISRSPIGRHFTKTGEPQLGSAYSSQFGPLPERVTPAARPGNLVASQDVIISVGPRHISAFWQADAFRQDLMSSPNRSAHDKLILADAELALGDLPSAEQRLQQLFAAESGDAKELARVTLRELSVTRLIDGDQDDPGVDSRKTFDSLQALSITRAERAQQLALGVQFHGRQNAWLASGTAARELARTGAEEFISLDPDGEYVVRGAVYARQGMSRAMASASGFERSRLLQAEQNDRAAALRTDSLESLEQYLALYGAMPEAAEIRNRLVDRLLRQHRLHAAETALQANFEDSDPQQQAIAYLLLTSMLAQAGLDGEAARTLETFQSRFQDVDLAVLRDNWLPALDTVFNREALNLRGQRTEIDAKIRTALPPGRFINALRPGTNLRTVFRNRQPTKWDVDFVRVIDRGVTSPRPTLNDVYTQTRRHATSHRLDLDIIPQSGSGRHDWVFFDRVSGTERGKVSLPLQTDIDFRSLQQSPTHVIPVGSMGRMSGVSLLEVDRSAPLWQLQFPPAELQSEIIEAGPSTPAVSIFYTQRHLFGVDAATGQLLWRRSGLELSSGAIGDLRTHLFGDDQVLVVFQRDGLSYTLLATDTGDVLRTGQIDSDLHQQLRVPLGRRLVHTARDIDNRVHLRIWDPLTDRIEFDEVPDGHFAPTFTSDGSLVLIGSDGRFRLFAPSSSQVVVDVKLELPMLDRLDQPFVFEDGDFVYVNLRRNDQHSRPGARYVQPPDMTIPVERLHYGQFVAIDRRTQKVLWVQSCRTASVLRLENGRLPFLVTAVFVQPKGEQDSQSLHVDVIDRQTGISLGCHETLMPARLVHYDLDCDSGRLSLYGLTRRREGQDRWQTSPYGMVSRIDLDFSRKTQQIRLEDEPL